jgi:hypothetical protein
MVKIPSAAWHWLTAFGRLIHKETAMSFVGTRQQLINLDHVRKLQHFEDNTVEITYSDGDTETIAKEQQPELYQELVMSIRVKGDTL